MYINFICCCYKIHHYFYVGQYLGYLIQKFFLLFKPSQFMNFLHVILIDICVCFFWLNNHYYSTHNKNNWFRPFIFVNGCYAYNYLYYHMAYIIKYCFTNTFNLHTSYLVFGRWFFQWLITLFYLSNTSTC